VREIVTGGVAVCEDGVGETEVGSGVGSGAIAVEA